MVFPWHFWRLYTNIYYILERNCRCNLFNGCSYQVTCRSECFNSQSSCLLYYFPLLSNFPLPSLSLCFFLYSISSLLISFFILSLLFYLKFILFPLEMEAAYQYSSKGCSQSEKSLKIRFKYELAWREQPKPLQLLHSDLLLIDMKL